MAANRPSSSLISARIRSMAMEILDLNNETEPTSAVILCLVSWIPLSDGVVLNSDGSSFGNPGQAGFGGLLRDSVEA
ncbi:hypothetical protein SESBI_30382 [Sesbania bispinosa]|nr:hypothetical protein SESBI_30382 [Sesbania bispinosa]